MFATCTWPTRRCAGSSDCSPPPCAVAPGDTGRAEVVAGHAEVLCTILHTHHEGEDPELWPKLAERGGEEAAAFVPTMEQQHRAIEEGHKEVTGLLAGWRSTAQGGDEPADAFERLATVIIEHMALEEKEILPLAEKYVTASEWHRIGQHGMETASKKDLTLAFGMAKYEGDPEVIKGVLATAPPPLRLLVPILARRRYTAHAKRVHGTATPRRVGS